MCGRPPDRGRNRLPAVDSRRAPGRGRRGEPTSRAARAAFPKGLMSMTWRTTGPCGVFTPRLVVGLRLRL